MRLLEALFLLSTVLLPACAELTDELGETTSELVVEQWPNDSVIPDKFTSRQVAIAPWKSRLYMAHTDHSNISTTEILLSWWDGETWSSSLTTGKYSSTRPALAAHDGRLYLAYVPVGSSTLRMTSTATLTWTPQVAAGRSLAIGNHTASMPFLYSFERMLYLAYCTSNGSASYVNVDRFDGTSWTALHQVPVSYVPSTYCTHALLNYNPDGQELELFYGYNVVANGTAKGYVRRQVSTTSGRYWQGGESFGLSNRPVSAVFCGNHTHYVHNGSVSPTELWWKNRSLYDNGIWATGARVPNQWSSAGATLGCMSGSTLLMVHNESGSAHRIMQSMFNP